MPLRRPYTLSFVTLDAFDAVFVDLTLEDGRHARGEVVPLPGYSDDTPEGVFRAAQTLADTLPGTPLADLRGTVIAQAAGTCVAPLFLTALDTLDAGTAPLSVPIIAATSTRAPELTGALCDAAAAGFETVKVKVGPDIDLDLRALRQVARRVGELPIGLRLRFDANQAYDAAAARRLLELLSGAFGAHVALLEQPLPIDEWTDFEALASSTDIPLMLDESIRGEADIRRAAEVGARLVKLKLYKQGGVVEVRALAELARSLGLGVVLGNGVATDITNLLELRLASAHPTLFEGASEAVGFAKLTAPVQHAGLRAQRGHAVI